MLKHEYAVLCQYAGIKHQVGNLGQVLKLIRGIGKDKVELGIAACNIFEHIALDRQAPVGLDRLHDLADKPVVIRIVLHAHHVRASPGYKLYADAAGTREQVQCRGILQVNPVGQYIEQALLGKIGSGTCLERSGHIKPSVSVYSADYPHDSYSCLLEKRIHPPLCADGFSIGKSGGLLPVTGVVVNLKATITAAVVAILQQVDDLLLVKSAQIVYEQGLSLEGVRDHTGL